MEIVLHDLHQYLLLLELMKCWSVSSQRYFTYIYYNVMYAALSASCSDANSFNNSNYVYKGFVHKLCASRNVINETTIRY